SSGGAVIAAGYALGFSFNKMEKMASDIPFELIKDFNVKNLLSLNNPSVFSGKALDKFFQKIYGNATMKDCKIECRISVVTILGRNRKLITPDSHPDLPVWKAVRMSSTIPFIFPYYELDNLPVTDGGLVARMFDIFPENERKILAIRPRANHSIRKNVQDVKANYLFIWNYLKILAEYLLDAADNQHIPEQEWARTIIVPTEEIGGFSFNIGTSEVNRLIPAGYNAVINSELLN
ncbi:MAG: patatin-like phospholipase family protein, partial [Phycisphaerales bacterium]|nr:patatin-like phospholipase family protein [Phycisphaerales bacterium]